MSHEEQWINHANRYIGNGQYRGAERVLCRLLGESPDHSRAHALLATLLTAQKRLDAATVEANIAASLDPEEPLAQVALMDIAIAELRFADAQEHSDRWLTLDPYDPYAFKQRASLRLLQNRKAEALADLDYALTIDPGFQSAYAARGHLLLDQGDIDGAEKQALLALAIGAEHSGSLVLMGYVLLKRGRTAEAREHAISALRNSTASSGPIRLLSAIKARQSWTLGLWWRWQSWMNEQDNKRVLLILVGAFVVYRLLTIRLGQVGYTDARTVVNVVWLALVAYTWFSPVLWKRMLDRELKPVQLHNY